MPPLPQETLCRQAAQIPTISIGDGLYVSTGEELESMTNLSKLIREAADHTFWRVEVERVAVSLGIIDPEHVEIAWQAISESIDSLQVLAFDYRHKSDEFLPVLRSWYMDQKSNWHLRNDQMRTSEWSELGSQGNLTLTHTLHSKLLGRVEATYEIFQAEQFRARAIEIVETPILGPNEAGHARETIALLRKAVNKIKHMQRMVPPSAFELDIFKKIIEAWIRHFESMVPEKLLDYEDAA